MEQSASKTGEVEDFLFFLSENCAAFFGLETMDIS